MAWRVLLEWVQLRLPWPSALGVQSGHGRSYYWLDAAANDHP
jgi:hypothetical protein